MKQLPESINITEFGIEINWDKQNKHIYPFKYLRLQCSCAGCVEEMTGKKLLNVQTIQDDIIAVDFSDIAFQPMHNPLSQLIYAASGHQVSHTWIAGQCLYKDGKHTQLDIGNLTTRVESWRQKIQGEL